MACKKLKFPGRDVVLEYYIGCGDALPAENDWRRFGSLRTKEFTVEWDTIDATDSDSVGALRENLASFQTLTISGDGTVKSSGAGAQNLIDLTKHVMKPDATGGQPVVWMRMTFPDLTFTAFMLISNLSRSAPYDDVTTYSFEASATASDFGLIVEDTLTRMRRTRPAFRSCRRPSRLPLAKASTSRASCCLLALRKACAGLPVRRPWPR